MFDGRVRLNLPDRASVNEDVTTYSLYPLSINALPIIVKDLGSKFTPLSQKDSESGPYIDENSTVIVAFNNPFELSVEAYNNVDIQNGIVVSGSGAQNLRYVWRKDGIVLTQNSRLSINQDKLTFTSVIKSDSGAYTVDIENDVGFITSDVINLEVIQFTEVEGFYSNLVQNFNASQNISSWTEVSTQGSEIITKKFVNNNSKLVLTGNPVEDFNFTGYAYPDHFNEAEVYDGTFKTNSELSINSPLLNRVDNFNILSSLTYFTRRPYVSFIDQGSNRVQFYQDIDLTDYKRYIDGTITGVEGVQANFQCFIGNSISYFIPKKNLQTATGRIPTDQYCFELGLPKPRLAVENSDYVQVVSEDYTTVYIEEYENADLVKIHSPLNDPYRTTYTKETVQPTNNNPAYETGFLTYKNEEGSAKIGDNLFSFFEDIGKQPSNLGQYISLRKLDIHQLNRRTNKIRIRVEFFHNGLQQTQGDSPADIVKLYRTDGILLIPTYLQDLTQSKKTMVDSYTFGKRKIKPNATFAEILPLYNQPRNFITGFVLYIQPVESKQSEVVRINERQNRR